jgi:Xaa-Pro aminopeptidase
LLSIGSDRYFITDGRYSIEARESIKSCEVIESDNLLMTVVSYLRKQKNLLIDPKEWSFADISFITNRLPRLFIQKREDFFRIKRAIKTNDEIKKIENATIITDRAFNRFAEYLVNYGSDKSENYLQYKAKSIFSEFNEFELSFEPILAFNKNTAKPHARPTQKLLNNGDVILFDAGIKFMKYCSDRTRVSTFSRDLHFHHNQIFNNLKLQKIYDTVREAHDRAINSIRVGMRAKDIDKIARDIISNSGFGKFFVHSLGHGVGLDIHEFPFISKKSDMIIEDGMVFTIEPGIYIPDEFGVRIEDIVVIKNGRAEIL